MNLIFEKADPSQSNFLTQFAIDSSKYYKHWKIPEEKGRPIFALKKEHFENGLVCIMKLNDEVIGFFSLYKKADPKGNTLHILDHLFIKPTHIKKGYGTLLFAEAMKTAKEELKWEAVLFESDSNAKDFYKKMGAKQIGDNPSTINPGTRCPVFIYTIS